MRRARCIILDFDGTVVESVGIKDHAFRSLFEAYPDQLERIMHYHLSTNATIRFEKFEHICRNILGQPYSRKDEARLNRRFSELIVEKIIECPFVRGAREFLDLYRSSRPLYLVSVSPAGELDRILRARALKEYFTAVYAHPWEKREALRHILRREGLDPRQAVFIGDSPEDYAAAKDVGVPFIGRNSGKVFPDGVFPVIEDFYPLIDPSMIPLHRGKP